MHSEHGNSGPLTDVLFNLFDRAGRLRLMFLPAGRFCGQDL
jgi:hypothetical protein